MPLAEALGTTRMHRAVGRTSARTAWVTARPCRALRHTISGVGWIGGGHLPRPGEVSLARHGMRFRDARPACRRHVLAVWRQPLEESLLYIESGCPSAGRDQPLFPVEPVTCQLPMPYMRVKTAILSRASWSAIFWRP